MEPGGATPRARRARISRSGDFDAVYRRGRSVADRVMVVYAFRRPDAAPGEPARLGLSVSRKVGGAVERNRVKRVLRERFAQVAGRLEGVDVVVIARAGLHELIDEHGSAALGERLAALLERVREPEQGAAA
jgi:ribonuclease P protein component